MRKRATRAAASPHTASFASHRVPPRSTTRPCRLVVRVFLLFLSAFVRHKTASSYRPQTPAVVHHKTAACGGFARVALRHSAAVRRSMTQSSDDHQPIYFHELLVRTALALAPAPTAPALGYPAQRGASTPPLPGASSSFLQHHADLLGLDLRCFPWDSNSACRPGCFAWAGVT